MTEKKYTKAEIEAQAVCATTDERYWQMPDGTWWWEEYDDEWTQVTQDTVDWHTDGRNGVGIMVFVPASTFPFIEKKKDDE